MKYFEDLAAAIGQTPLMRITRAVEVPDGTLLLGKHEGRNPAYCVKDRIGASMILSAEECGLLKPGMEIIEPTSGNTGIALASIGTARGYKVTLTMPESMSIERRRVIKAFGANVLLTAAEKGMSGAIAKATELAESDPKRYFMPQQFKNPSNPAVHEQTTGPEIWQDTDGQIDVLVCGVGTGGTITGISRYIKNTCGKPIISVAVEPEDSPVISQKLAGEELVPGPHMIQGIGAGFIPDTLDLSIIDRVAKVSNDESFEMARRLATDEGLLVGISSGAAMVAAARLVTEAEFAGKTIVVILPDLGERYLSTVLFP
jgi:cysteine synthase A